MKANSYTIVFLIIITLSSSGYSFAQQDGTTPKIGLVLSGGGAKGFAHIGVLKVLVEAGVPIDYIGGTSMGGIIGGLFAIGYHPDTLKQVVLKQDWEAILSDQISRRDLSMPEKDEDGKYFFSLPFRDKRIQLPGGLVAGQSVYDMLVNYCSPAIGVDDFSQFPIPFLCVAADIENGESVTINHGYLPEALRATMAIPTFFTPVEIDGRLLVDGGLINNFPVKEVRDMGADILIGVDVQDKLLTKEELTSFFKILDQASSFLRLPKYEEALQLTDIYIKPNISGFGVASFTSADTLIELGEVAARKALPQILAMLDSLKHFNLKPSYTLQANPVDSVLLNEVVIEGINRVSPGAVNGLLQLDVLKYHSLRKINNSIRKLYGSLNFDRITYRIDPLDRGGHRFTINLNEKRGGEFRVGLHYDTEFRASLLLNMTFRNIIISGGRLIADLALGDNSKLLVDYLYDRGWKPGFGLRMQAYNFDVYLYEENTKYASLKQSAALIDLYTQSNFKDISVMGAGIEFELSNQKSDVLITDLELDKNFNTNFFAYFRLDDLDRAVYPHTGKKLNLVAKLITGIMDTTNLKADPNFFITLNYRQAIPVHKRVTLQPSGYFGTVFTGGDYILPHYKFFLGGLSEIRRNGIYPFVGLNFMQVASTNAFAARLDLQYEFARNFFVIPRYNIAFHSQTFDKIFTVNRAINGWGIGLGIKTLIGPVEINVMSSDYTKELMGYFTLGYNF